MTELKSINPSNYRSLGQVDISTPFEVSWRVLDALRVQESWADLGVAGRVQLLRNALAEFEKRKDEIIRWESLEMGKPITAAASDFSDALTFANWYLDNVEKCLSPETTYEDEKYINQVYYEPLGTAAVIIPWNYPFLMFIWTAYPNLIVGNSVVLKHSEECPLTGRLIEEVMRRHLPGGAFSEVYGDGNVGQFLVNSKIDLISFTGSTKTGQKLYEIAAKKGIRAVMEMGGSAPGIVFEDADIDEAVKSICFYRLANAGQYCDGLKRLIVHESVFDKVVEMAAAGFAAVKIGLADDPTTEMGPLAAKRQLDLLVSQVEDAKRSGAKVITGGNSLEKEMGGAFHQPTVLTGITGNMRVWKEEVFGPVLPILSFSGVDEALRLANDTDYGLGAYVYTSDIERADRMASKIQSGMVSINGANYTTPWNPFGGYKRSGIGREHGKWGFHDLTQVKVVARPK